MFVIPNDESLVNGYYWGFPFKQNVGFLMLFTWHFEWPKRIFSRFQLNAACPNHAMQKSLHRLRQTTRTCKFEKSAKVSKVQQVFSIEKSWQIHPWKNPWKTHETHLWETLRFLPNWRLYGSWTPNSTHLGEMPFCNNICAATTPSIKARVIPKVKGKSEEKQANPK